MIFAMSDETFSITCSAEPPEGVDKGWFMFFITLLDQFYWVPVPVLARWWAQCCPSAPRAWILS